MARQAHATSLGAVDFVLAAAPDRNARSWHCSLLRYPIGVCPPSRFAAVRQKFHLSLCSDLPSQLSAPGWRCACPGIGYAAHQSPGSNGRGPRVGSNRPSRPAGLPLCPRACGSLQSLSAAFRRCQAEIPLIPLFRFAEPAFRSWVAMRLSRHWLRSTPISRVQRARPSVHQMVLTLERAGFIQRQPGALPAASKCSLIRSTCQSYCQSYDDPRFNRSKPLCRSTREAGLSACSRSLNAALRHLGSLVGGRVFGREQF